MGAGILPVAIYKNDIYYLLGREVSDYKYSDFGGSKDKKETTYDTAIREGYEELSGFLGSKYDIQKLIKNNLICKLKYKTFTSYVVLIEYDEKLPFYFNNNFKFIKKNFPNLVDKKGFFEKSEIRWFRIDELYYNKHNIREFYQNIIDDLVVKHSTIKNALLLRNNRV